ncbi:unnamed protein product [Pylaiella littoralis]
MAELGDLLTGGSSKLKDVTIEMLDYAFLDKCTDSDLIRAIVRKLKSGEEGYYPDLVKHAETRLLEGLPQAERSKILRMKAEPQPEEIHEAINDLHGWEEEIASLSSKTKASGSQQQHAPKWNSHTTTEKKNQTTKTVEFSRTTGERSGKNNSEQPTGLAIEPKETKKLNAYDFRQELGTGVAWEQYNADGEVERLEQEEQEEQRRKFEATTTAKARIEQDRLRRAKKRDDQLHDVGKGRFKETLSLLERRRAAERERVKGNESFKVKEYDEAFRCYTCSLALNDTNARVYNNRAATAHHMERFDQAEDDCTRAISLDPAFKKAWMRRGMVRHSRGKYADSVADFTEALLLDPNDKHAKKLREHSAAKEREVNGETAGQTQGICVKKRGRILIEEVDTLQEDVSKHSEMVFIPTTTAAAAPPTIGSKKTLITNGRVQVA